MIIDVRMFLPQTRIFSIDLHERLLAPVWRKPSTLSKFFAVETAKQFAETLAGVKMFGGGLVFSHTLEYPQLWDQSATHPLFQCHMKKYVVARHIRPGTNGVKFLDVIRAMGERGGGPRHYTLKNLAQDVLEVLPRSVICEGCNAPVVIEFPHFNETDAQQNSCKCLQCFQSHITGDFGGRQRDDEVRKRKASEVTTTEVTPGHGSGSGCENDLFFIA